MVKPIVSRLTNQYHVVVGTSGADFPSSMFEDGVESVVVMGHTETSCEVVSRALNVNANLRWVHSLWTGIDGFKLGPIAKQLKDRGVLISNARGSFAAPLAEHVLLSCLYFNRSVPKMKEATLTWNRYSSKVLRGQSVVIVGYGSIGAECGRVLRLHGMNVTGVRTRASNDVDGVRIVDMKGMWDVLPSADFLVNVLPLTTATRHLISRPHFEAMKSSSVYINIGRGATTVERDLVDALLSGKLKGAAVDVFETEPFPKDSLFLTVPPEKLLLTPHNADVVDGIFEDASSQFADAAITYVNTGALPEYAVDLEKGY